MKAKATALTCVAVSFTAHSCVCVIRLPPRSFVPVDQANEASAVGRVRFCGHSSACRREPGIATRIDDALVKLPGHVLLCRAPRNGLLDSALWG